MERSRSEKRSFRQKKGALFGDELHSDSAALIDFMRTASSRKKKVRDEKKRERELWGECREVVESMRMRMESV